MGGREASTLMLDCNREVSLSNRCVCAPWADVRLVIK